jgi:hypothetical protein
MSINKDYSMDKISKPFIKENRKGFIVFDFEDERWQRINKFYDRIMFFFLILTIWVITGETFSATIRLATILFLPVIIIVKPIFIHKKYSLKTVKINRETIDFTYDNYKDNASLPFPKDKISLIVHSEKDKLALEYEGHIMNFKNGSDLTIFLDNLVSRLRLEFDKSLETGVNQEVLHYKVIPTNSKKQ